MTYLNTASTAFVGGNPSDVSYPEVLDMNMEYQQLSDYVCKLVNAPIGAQVIVTSGATEGIASCMKWASDYDPGSVVMGGSFDHPAVSANALNYGLRYQPVKNYTDEEHERHKRIAKHKRPMSLDSVPDALSMVFLTHVHPQTGEILDIDGMVDVLANASYIDDDVISDTAGIILRYKPLVVVDVTQSITHLPIDMRAWDANALLFSWHKLGGPVGVGMMVIAPPKHIPYKPLIAGSQQHKLRGGTYPLYNLLQCDWLGILSPTAASTGTIGDKTLERIDGSSTSTYSGGDTLTQTGVDKWKHCYDRLTTAGIKVYNPKTKHMYNTLLIPTYKCPLDMIHTLAKRGVYVGTSTACSGGSDNHIRISYTHPDDITDDTLDTIIEVYNSSIAS